jgi:hypothetical protein
MWKSIVEPIFGQIKEWRGFWRFSLRGLEKVSAEWKLICLTHHRLSCSAQAKLVPPTIAIDIPYGWLRVDTRNNTRESGVLLSIHHCRERRGEYLQRVPGAMSIFLRGHHFFFILTLSVQSPSGILAGRLPVKLSYYRSRMGVTSL